MVLLLGHWDLVSHRCIEGDDGEPGAVAVGAVTPVPSCAWAGVRKSVWQRLLPLPQPLPPEAPPTHNPSHSYSPSLLELKYRGEGGWPGAAGADDLALEGCERDQEQQARSAGYLGQECQDLVLRLAPPSVDSGLPQARCQLGSGCVWGCLAGHSC